MSLLALFGCSPTSKDLPASLSDLRVTIRVEDHTDRTNGSIHSRRSIRAVLSDARGKDIERSDVKIEVNGVPMEFGVSRGNYYDRHPYYSLHDDPRAPAAPDTELTFTLMLPDGVRREIGTVRTPAPLALEQIDFPEKRPAAGAVAIGWRDLAESAELVLYRCDTRREADGTRVLETGSINDPAALRRTIGPGWFRSRSGTWTVPAKFLTSDAQRTLRDLGAEIIVTTEGRMAGAFAKQSMLTAERRLRLQMEFTPFD